MVVVICSLETAKDTFSIPSLLPFFRTIVAMYMPAISCFIVESCSYALKTDFSCLGSRRVPRQYNPTKMGRNNSNMAMLRFFEPPHIPIRNIKEEGMMTRCENKKCILFEKRILWLCAYQNDVVIALVTILLHRMPFQNFMNPQ